MTDTATDPAMDRNTGRVASTVSDEVAIQIEVMNKWFGTFHVLRDID